MNLKVRPSTKIDEKETVTLRQLTRYPRIAYLIDKCPVVARVFPAKQVKFIDLVSDKKYSPKRFRGSIKLGFMSF